MHSPVETNYTLCIDSMGYLLVNWANIVAYTSQNIIYDTSKYAENLTHISTLAHGRTPEGKVKGKKKHIA